MGNRKLPFGYRMEFGVEVVHPEEAQVVRDIFSRYLAGESFKLLAEWLESQPIPYDEGKPWNKNMVARILEDCRYAGGKDFPPIIEDTALKAAAERRKGRQSPVHRTEADKVLRQLSGRPPTAKITTQVLLLLNRLIQDTEVIRKPPPPSQMDATTCRWELDQVLSQLPVDEDKANALVRQSAFFQYQAIGPGDYETERLRRVFAASPPMERLDADLLRSTVASIIVERNTVVSIRLKNQQIIERRELA